ncbi:CBS domain-containing protein [Corticimicrobacter populi]|uniref:Sugar kinase n=1 Tax=Corticimicrobacter populi TaxID=2175229 RepID=A0A2V1JW20_9BURK|nr:CBS domain-containing protein [Corticimicrobacter populi]PWF21223.1 sugar kinase [Corticimicrobacter populi]
MKQLLDLLTLGPQSTVMDAVTCIEAGKQKIAFVIEPDGRLVGVVVDGDVRRYLLSGGSTDALVEHCMNRHFKSVRIDAPREELLKLFDLGYHAIPGVDEHGRLCDIYTRQLRAEPEVPILTRARAPVRMSFCGGGSDLTYFFVDHAAAVLNCTVALYSHATLLPRADGVINIYAEDLNQHEHYADIQELLQHENKSLLSSVVSLIRPEHGFDLYLRSDFPVGSGLGGSSAATTAVIAAFNELRQDHWNAYEIAELAFQAERLCFGVSGGWQDQYASAFGGFNLMEFENQNNRVHPIRLEESVRSELEACLLLCDTGVSHDSGNLHEQQRQEMQPMSSQSESLKASVSLCRRMHHYLIRSELNRFGRCLHEIWMLKKQFSKGVSSTHFDGIYEAALAAGALGGKLLGAGGGGFFLFYVQPPSRRAVVQALKAFGCTPTNFRFDFDGVTSWRTKTQ